MKTLNEVLNALKNCGRHQKCCIGCPYESVSYPKVGNTCKDVMHNDALQYLKEFKRISARLEKIALGNITETLEKMDNPALTWQELRTMEGKPVWIEFLNDEGKWNGEWCLVESSNDILCEILRCKMTWWGSRKITLGKTWQAYRKERL